MKQGYQGRLNVELGTRMGVVSQHAAKMHSERATQFVLEERLARSGGAVVWNVLELSRHRVSSALLATDCSIAGVTACNVDQSS